MAASNTADLFYQLFDTFTFLAVVVGGIVLSLIGYLVVRYRGRDSFPEPADAPTLGHIPSTRGHARTVVISVTLSAIVIGVLIFGSINTTNIINTVPAECLPQPGQPYGDCVYITVTAMMPEFRWDFGYKNGQTLLGNLTVPLGRIVVLQITSKAEPGRQAVFHSFGIDEYRIKRDAIPGLTNTLWFKATDMSINSLRETIRCFELCGLGHSSMTGRVNVVQPGSFQGFCSSSGC